MRFQSGRNRDDASTTDSDRTPLLPRFHHTESKSPSSLASIGTAISVVFFLIGCIRLVFMITSYLPHPIEPARPEPAPIEIAIIGAGPAGIAAADKLRTLAQQRRVLINLTIFEQSHAIGGRLVLGQKSQLIYPWNDETQSPIEPEDITGPSLLFSNNVLRSHATSTGARPAFRDSHVALGIFDGKSVSFDITCPSTATSWGSWLGQIFKYGASIWRAAKLPTGTMGKLHRLTTLDKQSGFPFATVESMIIALGLSEETEMRGIDRNRRNSISETYQNEVMTPETHRRLGQDVAEINDLALSMALQDVDQSPSHSGGSTREILEEMMRRSGAGLRLNTRVISLHYELISEDKKVWIVESRQEGSEQLEFSAYENIIFAAPWDSALTDVEKQFDFPMQQAEYRSRYLTFFTSRKGLSSSYFGKTPEQILPRIDPNASPEQLSGVHEIAFVREITRVIDDQVATESLFRILSTSQIDDEVLRSIITDGDQDSMTWVHRAFIPHAYPLLFARTSFPPMRLSASFWHTSAMETFTSSIDGALFAGENVAALLMRQLEMEKSKR
ncbi:hypothetical protein MMC07_008700 [Pseudocyphellaria aurata]|nr:hypothetical protein [Pseudocyphellaria aurata]